MATKANLNLDQGTTFATTLNLTDQNGDMMNLSGYTVQAQMKRYYTSSKSVSFTASVNSAAGSVTLSLTANQTSLIYPDRYVYDVLVTDSSNNVSRIVEGLVTVNPGVTNETLETKYAGSTYENYFSNAG